MTAKLRMKIRNACKALQAQIPACFRNRAGSPSNTEVQLRSPEQGPSNRSGEQYISGDRDVTF
ncbi:hypothetical protein [Roseibium sp. SCP14]|uniref:hypothetical protein n=1 Tax=Roseibium sp. SCP14 TaxID=3141375 RepID=UPI0033394D9C